MRRRFHREFEILPSPLTDNERRLKSRSPMYICGYTRADLHWSFLEGCSTRGVPRIKTETDISGGAGIVAPRRDPAINSDTRLVATNPLYIFDTFEGGRRGGITTPISIFRGTDPDRRGRLDELNKGISRGTLKAKLVGR